MFWREVAPAVGVTRPVLRYHGGKWRIAPWIIAHFPPHHFYVEPFGGGASVLLQKPAARTEIYNDLDREIFNLFQVARDPVTAAELARAVELTPFAREEYASAYEPIDSPIELARRTLVKSFMGMGSKGIWVRSGFDARVNPDGFVSRLNAFRALPGVIGEVMLRLQRVLLENVDALLLIDRYRDHADVLFYVDPPYVRGSYGGAQVYRHRYADADHRALAEKLVGIKGQVILSGYDSPLYASLFTGWRREECPALADAAAARTEVLWINPAAARALHHQHPTLALDPVA